jgi:uncharacterized protein (TIGR02594 family)
LSFRTNSSYATLLSNARERAAEMASQTLSLRGRAAAGVAGGAALGVLTLGSVAGAVAASDQPEVHAATVAGQAAGAGKAGQAVAGAGDVGQAVAAPGQLAEKADKSAVEKKARKTAERVSGATASEVIELAEEQVGIKERNGRTKFHEWYIKNPAAKLTAARDGGSVADYMGAAWCNMFVSWIGEKTGAKGMGADAWTVAHAKWFEKTDRWGEKAKPGAVVFFAWDGGGMDSIEHVGLVVKDNGDGTITTIEGNTGNAVKKKIRDESDVVGYGYPDYRK